mgnify:CR=1 FL=1|jgi:hypothetical protein
MDIVILYVAVGILVVIALLLFLFVQILNARARAALRETMRDDVGRLDDLPPIVQVEPPKMTEEPTPEPTSPDDDFMPSTVRMN